ncbi:hypothetical protein [Acuticoccus yangtzensis]|uniref:hypothetical protein n=1 Tax=Acuticoccus yangtzensis TaxID=1443441 RepID=UPI0009496996|nr:hypothetical protein [Acuticoccus yangtzensis]
MVGLGLGPIRGVPFSPSVTSRDTSQSSHIPADVKLLYLKGYAEEADGGQHSVRRVASEPSHAGKVRTSDRFMPDGSVDAVNGGWWEIAEVMPSPEMFGAVGDGIADDTAAIRNWLEYGGGRADDGRKTYLFDPIVLTTPATVVCARDTTFKLRSGWASWTGEAGHLEVRADLSWSGGRFDGSRGDTDTMAGLEDIFGVAGVGQQLNQYKAGIFVRASSDVTIDLRGIVFVDQVNLALYCKGSTSGVVGGVIEDLAAVRCGLGYRFDRCRELYIGEISAREIDNRLAEDNDVYFPAFFHIVHMLRSESCPARKIDIETVTGRAGRYGVSSAFMNGITWVGNTRCPIHSASIQGMGAAEGQPSDYGGQTIRETVSILGVSWISNDSATRFDELSFFGTATQGIEVITDYDISFGRMLLWSDGGRQNVLSGSAAINSHGDARPAENVGNGRHKRNGRITFSELIIRGQWHYGIWARKNTIEVGSCSIRECRADPILLDNQDQIEFESADEPQRASVIIHDADIAFCGGQVRVVSGERLEIHSGRVSDNCQRSGYDDPTLSGSAFTRTQGVAYDAAHTDAGIVDRIYVSPDVQTAPLAKTADTSTGISFMPGLPVRGSEATVPELDLYYGFITATNPSEIHLGQRMVLKNLNGTTDITVWPVYSSGDVFLVEVADADKAIAWSTAGHLTSMSGTWDYVLGDDEVDGTGGNIEADLDGPAYLSTPYGVLRFQNLRDEDGFYIDTASDWGVDAVNTVSQSFTNGTLQVIDTGFVYAQSQTSDYAIGDADVLSQSAGMLTLSTFAVASLPSAAGVAGSVVYVSDAAGGAVLAFSNGTNWLRVTDRVVVS